MKGILRADSVMLVSKAKREIGQGNDSDYYFELSFVAKDEDGNDNIFTCTSGKKWDSPDFPTFKKYNLGFDYANKKLRIVDFELAMK